MKKTLTNWGLLLLLAGLMAPAALAQPVRNGVDVIWAPDVMGATLTLDGTLDEAEWASADSIKLVWGADPVAPGSGQRTEGEPALADPLDGNDGTLYTLRSGNTLWMGLDVKDKSIGGSRGLQVGNWFFDGFIMNIIDRSRRDLINYSDPNNFGTGPAEFIYGWWLPSDTLAGGLPIPGIAPRFFGNYGVGFNDSLNTERTQDKIDVLNWAYSIDGTANDDTHGEDVGYQYEVVINLELLGYDFTQEGGDKVPFNIALQDADYQWPNNPDQFFVSRVWFQNQWANNLNEGAAFIYGAPTVTVGTALPDVTDAEFVVQNVGEGNSVTVDGVLDEASWDTATDPFYMQYQATADTMDQNPGAIAPWYHRWFRPDINGDNNAAVVVDPSLAVVKMLVEGNKLLIGVDVADQAISGASSEGGRDGIRIAIRELDSLTTALTLNTRQLDVYIDSSGVAQLDLDALALATENPESVTAFAALKGASTAADPTDIDEGYQLEIAVDLAAALGYPDGLGDRQIWVALNYFDGDYLENPADSYAMRTWISGERNTGAAIYGYLRPVSSVAVEDGLELPNQIALRGNFPNPFNPTTTLSYALPMAGDVTISVFDVLGREIRTLTAGLQAPGSQSFTFDAAGLASGLYLYRIQVADAALGVNQVSGVGKMLLLK